MLTSDTIIHPYYRLEGDDSHISDESLSQRGRFFGRTVTIEPKSKDHSSSLRGWLLKRIGSIASQYIGWGTGGCLTAYALSKTTNSMTLIVSIPFLLLGVGGTLFSRYSNQKILTETILIKCYKKAEELLRSPDLIDSALQCNYLSEFVKSAPRENLEEAKETVACVMGCFQIWRDLLGEGIDKIVSEEEPGTLIKQIKVAHEELRRCQAHLDAELRALCDLEQEASRGIP